MTEIIQSIPARLKNVSVGGHVAGAADIIDDNADMTLDQLSTKPATTGTTGDYPYNGMGRVTFKKNLVSGVPTLTQDMFYKGAAGSRVPNTNTVFVIKYDFILSENITIPENSILLFEGGSISAGSGADKDTITGQYTSIQATPTKIFGADIKFAGAWNIVSWYPEWFGAKGCDGSAVGVAATDDTDSIQCALNAAFKTNVKGVILLDKCYVIRHTLTIYNYCQLGGVESVNSRELKTVIIAYNTDAFNFETHHQTSDELIYICLKNFHLFGNGHPFVTANGEYDGIVIDGNGEKTISHINIINVCVEHTRFGLYVLNDGFKGVWQLIVKACCFIRNKIGYFVEGNKNHEGRATWYNVNSIVETSFNQNSIGGILIKNVHNSIGNKIIRCDIEGNGEGYNLQDYNTYGVFGIKFINSIYVTTAANIISDCYFEHNGIPVRSGTANTGEITYNGEVYPDGWDENIYCGCIVNVRHNLTIANNSFFQMYRFINSVSRASTRVYNNTCNLEEDFVSGITKKPIVSILNVDQEHIPGDVVVKDNKYTSQDAYKAEELSIKVPDSTAASDKEAVLIRLRETKIITDYMEYENNTMKKGDIFIGQGIQYFPYKVGLTKYDPLSSISLLYQWINDGNYSLNDVLNVKLVNDTWVYSVDTTIQLPCIRYYSDDKKVINLGGDYGSISFNSYCTIFENLTITCHPNVNSTHRMFIGADTRIDRVIFKNCIINMKNGVGFFDAPENCNINVIFDNCEFVSLDNQKLNIIYDRSTGLANRKVNFIFNNCVTVLSNVPTHNRGAFTDKPQIQQYFCAGFEYYDTTNNRKILWNGTEWTNVDGSSLQ